MEKSGATAAEQRRIQSRIDASDRATTKKPDDERGAKGLRQKDAIRNALYGPLIGADTRHVDDGEAWLNFSGLLRDFPAFLDTGWRPIQLLSRGGRVAFVEPGP